MTATHNLPENSRPAPWIHPSLEPESEFSRIEERPLFRTPTYFGEQFAADDLPQPTSAATLPLLDDWIPHLATMVLEIWAGRRQSLQVADRCHRVIYAEILRRIGSIDEVGRVRSVHINEPFDGLCEASVVVAFKQRYRSMVIRAEGINGRWLCTEIDLL